MAISFGSDPEGYRRTRGQPASPRNGGLSLALQHVGEADRAVEQRLDHELGSFADAVAFARPLQVFGHRLVAEPEDPRDLPVRFSARRPHDAVALAVGQLRRREKRRVTHLPDPSRRLEREGPRELRQRQMLLAERPADFRRERARTVRFAWHMRRNGEAVADPALRGQFENLAIAGRELDQVRQPGPREADAG